MNDPIGRRASFSPARARRTARDTARTASSCPTIRACSESSIRSSFSVSSSTSRITGMPVQLDTMSAMSSALTVVMSRPLSVFQELSSSSSFWRSTFSLSRRLAAFSKSWPLIASSFSRRTRSAFSRAWRTSCGRKLACRRILLDASSIRSIALSGRNRSEMYLSASVAAATSASSLILTPWCASYRSRSPRRISMLWSTVGSATRIGANRRSSAASRSTYFRYSSSVVAPMHCSSPRDSDGLRMLLASIAPSAAPAPTSVCSSSTKRMTSPDAFRISSITFFMRSSNSPRYFVPATSAARSSCTTRFDRSTSGTSPRTIRCARPSVIAVLPTPGSPIRAGLFLVRRDST